MSSETPLIYLDNASTSYPKPKEVREVLAHFYDKPIGSYGRSSDRHSIDISATIEELRDILAERIGACGMGDHIIFTHNATDGINRVLNGLPTLSADEVVISPMEHNAVTRPLYAKLDGGTPHILPHGADGEIKTDKLPEVLKEWQKKGELKLLILNGMSNVNGVIQPMEQLIRIFRAVVPRGLIIIDAAQSFPYTEPFPTELLPDFIAITGHKGSLGPTGTGALFIRNPERLKPVFLGGNGYRSEQQESPSLMPARFEAGTLNLLGLIAWRTALSVSPAPLISHKIWIEYINYIRGIQGITLHGALKAEAQGPLCSISSERYNTAELGDLLLNKYRIATRSGLHCAPLAHKTLGTLPRGTTRISVSALTPPAYLDILTEALDELHR